MSFITNLFLSLSEIKNNKMKSFIFVACIGLLFLSSCGGGNDKKGESQRISIDKDEPVDPMSNKGIGEITNVVLNTPLDPEMIKRGEGIYEMKCAACHKITGTRVVGPSWKGLTGQRTPEWIMNMITNTEAMLEQDPVAQKLLEECLTRMPNQGLSIGDARDVLEFMYSIDEDSK